MALLPQVREETMSDCKHVKETVGFDGEVSEKKHTSIFCPDCGQRIEDDYVSRPFQLPHSQRWVR